MAKRQSIDIEGVAHGAPIPMASKIGNVMYSSGIFGTDPKTGKTPETVEAQAEQAFENLRSLMKAAGGSPENVIYVTVYMKDRGQREAVNKAWLKLFPDEHSRPARHAIETSLPGGNFLQLQAVAVLDG